MGKVVGAGKKEKSKRIAFIAAAKEGNLKELSKLHSCVGKTEVTQVCVFACSCVRVVCAFVCSRVMYVMFGDTGPRRSRL